ncbi:MAG TPA: hypothetical protein VFX53_04520 [Pedococcus sp.]|nr:hypothetical protein [Pedococcus sp.]
MAEIEQQAYGTGAAAAYLGSSLETMKYWRKRWPVDNYGPRWFRMGRRVMYLKADLDAFIAAQRQETGPPQPTAPRRRRRDSLTAGRE